MNWELPDVQAGFRKGRGTKDQIANVCWITEKAGEFQKSFYFTDYIKAFVWITTNCEKFLKRWDYQTTFSASWETCMQVKKQQIEAHMEQWTGSKLGKEYIKAVHCHSAYLTNIQSTSWDMPGWMNHTGIKIFRRNINKLRCAGDTTLMAESKEELKSLLRVKEENVKVGVKLNIQKLRSWHLVPSLHDK